MKPILLVLFLFFSFFISVGQSEELFTVFPNPTSTGFFTLQLKQSSKIYTYTIFDFTGNEIISGKANSELEKKILIDVSTLPEGNYFLLVGNGNNRLTKKITIQG